MPRRARIVVPGLPHHITQRGNRREAIFFKDGDHEIYKDLLAEQTHKWKVEVWAYCLMPNHVHLLLNPATEEGLGRAVWEAHRRYTNFINARGRWTGHLFQSRFSSVAMDEGHLMSAVRYVSLNPVRARLVARAEEWKWSSVQAHLAGSDDGLVKVEPVLKRTPQFIDWLAEGTGEDYMELRRSESTGRPVGTEDFVKGLEPLLGRPIARRAPGRKPTSDAIEQMSLLGQINMYRVPE
ncbi:MAG TPA: transposase [Bryobacteraceae bacterium]|nr:transposase [Acidobacteriaceae bacterium]